MTYRPGKPEAPGEPYMTKLRNFLRDENGVTSIKYGLIASSISAVIIVVVMGVGSIFN
jgi:Flp pilus assembly pilin Flp